jgi:hypothetical protein
VEQLTLDFNSRNVRNEVRIGPAALERHRELLEHRIRPGDRVLVVDADGNRCIGTLRRDASRPVGHQFSVAMDWATWVDGEEAAVPPQRAVATG